MAYTTIDDPEAYFQIALYTGNNTTQSITLPGDTDMQPDMVWVKERNGAEAHNLQDAVRGSTYILTVNLADGHFTHVNNMTSFNSDGFSVGATDSMNDDGNTMVAWCWKESATAGFDIVAYTGTGSAHTESHSLSAVPHFIIIKNLSASDSWTVGSHKLGDQDYTDRLQLEGNGAVADDNTDFNDTAPTSSVFSVGTANNTNRNTSSLIAYLWSEKQGFSKFGKYTGNGNADGAFVYTGFKPAFVMTKNTGSGHDWWILDNKRDTDNPTNARLVANEVNAEDAAGSSHDFLSNGFKLRTSGSADVNGSGDTMIYMAFAEAPFVNSEGVPTTAR